MNRLTDGKKNIFKALYVFLLPFFVQIAALFVNGDNALIYFSVMLLLLSLTYSAPFLKNIYNIRIKTEKNIKRVILSDLLYIFAPAVLGAVLSDSVFSAAGNDAYGAGVFSLIVIVLFAVLTLTAWIFYKLVK